MVLDFPLVSFSVLSVSKQYELCENVKNNLSHNWIGKKMIEQFMTWRVELFYLGLIFFIFLFLSKVTKLLKTDVLLGRDEYQLPDKKEQHHPAADQSSMGHLLRDIPELDAFDPRIAQAREEGRMEAYEVRTNTI